jgi:hypothetical protein
MLMIFPLLSFFPWAKVLQQEDQEQQQQQQISTWCMDACFMQKEPCPQ